MRNKYWESREVAAREQNLDAAIAATEKRLAEVYEKSAKRIKREIESLYKDLLLDSSKLSDLYKYNRLYKLLGELNKQLRSMGKQEIKILGNKLNELYISNGKIIAQYHPSMDTSFLNIKQAEKILNTIWVNDGKNWSSRVWNNQSILLEKLQNNLTDCILTGSSTDDLVRDLQTTFNQSYSNVKRLVRTEMAHAQIQSTLDSYKEAGIYRYIFITAEDERVCEECNSLDNKEFNISDAQTGVNLPPIHPNCRCSIIAKI